MKYATDKYEKIRKSEKIQISCNDPHTFALLGKSFKSLTVWYEKNLAFIHNNSKFREI